MSTSLLYHGFGVREYRYVRTKYIPGGMVFTIERRTETCRYAACGSENVWREGVVVRRFRTVPIGNKRVELEARIPRLAHAEEVRTTKGHPAFCHLCQSMATAALARVLPAVGTKGGKSRIFGTVIAEYSPAL